MKSQPTHIRDDKMTERRRVSRATGSNPARDIYDGNEGNGVRILTRVYIRHPDSRRRSRPGDQDSQDRLQRGL